MKRRKNLERAVVLGLLLSTSVYGNAFAIDVTVSSYVMQPDNYIEGWDGKITAPESLKNLTVSDETAESIFKYGVLVTSDVKGKDNLYQNIIFDWKLNSLNIDITKLLEGSTNPDNNYYIAGVMVDGLNAEKTANLILTTNEGIYVKVDSQNNYAAAFADRFHASKSLNNSSSELKVFSILFRKLQNLLRINFASLTDIFFLPLEAIVKVSRYIKAGKIRSGFSPAGKPCRKAACKFKLCT